MPIDANLRSPGAMGKKIKFSCPDFLCKRQSTPSSPRLCSFTACPLGIDCDTVSKWRSRWVSAREALTAVEEQTDQGKPLTQQIELILRDAYRSGSPGKFKAEQVCQIIALACEDPEDSGRPVSEWTPRELAEEAIQRKIVPSISPRQVGRFLKSGRLETAPHRVLALS